LDRTQKQELVETLHRSLSGAAAVVVTRQSGMTVAEVTELRRQMRAAGASFKVTKNRLARLALKGTRFEGLDGFLTGPTAIAYSGDPVAAAKVASEFANSNNKLVIVGGGIGEQVLDAEGVQALAKLPSLTELRGKIAGLLQAPAAKLVGVLQAPGGQIARVLAAHARKGGAE
jgi:large subunit ribosomal protein L10